MKKETTAELFNRLVREVPEDVKRFSDILVELSALIADYMKKNDKTSEEMAALCNISFDRFDEILAAIADVTVKEIVAIEMVIKKPLINTTWEGWE